MNPHANYAVVVVRTSGSESNPHGASAPLQWMAESGGAQKEEGRRGCGGEELSSRRGREAIPMGAHACRLSYLLGVCDRGLVVVLPY